MEAKPHNLVICKLENQESWWYDSVQVHRPENWGTAVETTVETSQGIWRSKNQELWYLRAGKDGYLSSRSKRICPSFIFLLHLGPLWIAWCPSILVRVDLDSVYWINIFGKVFWLIPATRLEFAPAENSWKASQMGKLYGGQVRETWLSVSVKFLNHFS